MMRKFRLPTAIGATLALAMACASGAAIADTYPSQSVRILVSAVPGSSADLTARVLGRRLAQSLGQSFSVDTKRPNGADPMAVVSRAPKDGYTLLMATAANTIGANLSADGTPDLIAEFSPITLVATVPQVLVVPPALGVGTMRDLIALAKAKPGQLSFGSSGAGTSSHLAGEMFNLMAGVKIEPSPYPSIAAAVTDLLAGRVSAMFAPASAVLQLVEQGKLKGLATTGAKRAVVAPNLPTMQEAGIEGFETGLWFGLFAPKGTPQEIIDRLADAVNAALQAHEVRSALRVQGIDALGGTPQDFAKHIESETRKWVTVADEVGLKKSRVP